MIRYVYRMYTFFEWKDITNENHWHVYCFDWLTYYAAGLCYSMLSFISYFSYLQLFCCNKRQTEARKVKPFYFILILWRFKLNIIIFFPSFFSTSCISYLYLFIFIITFFPHFYNYTPTGNKIHLALFSFVINKRR